MTSVIHSPARQALELCAICSGPNLSEIWPLPDYPLTESFGPFDTNFTSIDQSLRGCQQCGHMQLHQQVDPAYLYSGDNYHFNPNESMKYSEEYEFLENFIARVVGDSKPDVILEFGANNLSFAQRLKRFGESLIVCDPLLPADIEDPELTILRSTIEDAAASRALGRPSLIVARHTLEHIGNPKSLLANLLEQAADDLIMVFEVPSFEHLVFKQRFDAITHQHLHYFHRSTVSELATQLDLAVVDWTFNPRGSNGGSLVFALGRSVSGDSNELGGPLGPRPDTPILAATSLAVDSFKRQMAMMVDAVQWDPRSVFGYGASLMLATLDYHLHQRISSLDLVFDDDPRREGLTYSNVDVQVTAPSAPEFSTSGTFVITSWENSRAIYRRLSSLGVGRIVAPILS